MGEYIYTSTSSFGVILRPRSMYEIGIKRLYHFTIYPWQVSELSVMGKGEPSLSTRVITWVVHQNRSQKGPFGVVTGLPRA